MCDMVWIRKYAECFRIAERSEFDRCIRASISNQIQSILAQAPSSNLQTVWSLRQFALRMS